MSFAQSNLPQWKEAIRSHRNWAFKVMEAIDIFQIEASLEELASRTKPASKGEMDKQLKKVVQMESREPQVVSGCWVDREGVILAVYFSYSGDVQSNSKKVTHINALTL